MRVLTPSCTEFPYHLPEKMPRVKTGSINGMPFTPVSISNVGGPRAHNRGLLLLISLTNGVSKKG